jgi:hypothetical protein
LHPRFAPMAAECLGHGPGVGHPVPPPGIYRGGEGVSRVPGGPPRTCPVLRPRRDRRRQAIAALRRGLPSCGRRRLPRRCRFRGAIARPVHSLSTLRSPGRPGTTQDSFPAAGPARPGGVGYPQGSNGRFLRFSILLSQAFLAHPLLDSTCADLGMSLFPSALLPHHLESSSVGSLRRARILSVDHAAVRIAAGIP